MIIQPRYPADNRNNSASESWTGTIILTALVLMLAACSRGERVTTNTLLAINNCKGTTAGVSLVSLAEVAGFRGTALISPPQEHSPAAAAADLPLFVALSRGRQPSRGFELHLADQAEVIDGTALQIPVYWTEPDPTKPHPQVTTEPCLVVSVPKGRWQTIEAIDQQGESLGVLELSPPGPLSPGPEAAPNPTD